MENNQTTEQTFGQKRVRASFNPSADSQVDIIKAKSADCIDFMQGHFRDGLLKELADDDTLTTIEEKAKVNEKIRLIRKAQEHFELAAMWATKALTV